VYVIRSTIRAVFFDFGNVIGTFDHRKACAALVPYCGVSVTPDDILNELFTDVGYLGLRQQGCVSGRELYAQVCERYQTTDALTFDCFAALWGNIFTVPTTDLYEIFQCLRDDVIVCVTSNTEALHWSHIMREPFMQWLCSSKRARFTCSFLVGYEKPCEEFYRAALKQVDDVDPSEVLYIDDVSEYLDAFASMGGKVAPFDLRSHTMKQFWQVLASHQLLA
jgi:FMN phosphatase YigB (HAD superfamily)